ncbi:unnamed protein product [Phytomonas sp. Hart1]|nr:unnamed protein product [Phytomonas sp. Hart1]|eukprot:CCW69905.1 unnamed protein product [Phytomonas sp. isolate Hart1]
MLTTKRRRIESLLSSSSNGNSLIISDAVILSGIRTEVVRTLPFWRCFVDLQRWSRTIPTLIDCEIKLLCRIPCEFFYGVDVVWAVADIRVRSRKYQTRSRSAKAILNKNSSPASGLPLSSNSGEYLLKDHLWSLGTMHFVHHDAHQNVHGDSRSYHIQSVVFCNQPELLQCVAGTMLSFAFISYTMIFYLDYQARLKSVRSPSTEDSTLPSDTVENGVFNGDDAENLFPDDPLLLRFSRTRTLKNSGGSWNQMKLLYPLPLRSVLILGMGGNSMVGSLRHALGSEVDLHVVEIEPAVLQACERVGALPNRAEDTHFHLHLEDAMKCLKHTLSKISFDMIFMDIFEPTEGKMKNDMRISNLCFDRLQINGLLVVNIHQLPSLLSLKHFGRLFGLRNIQAVNIHGWNESVVVCMKASSTPNWRILESTQGAGEEGKSYVNSSRDGLSQQCGKNLADMVYKCYEEVLPGWLPHCSWLKSSKRVGNDNDQCRIWES